jgi:hypothetical protein
MRRSTLVILGVAVLAVVAWGSGISLNPGAPGQGAHPALMTHAAAAQPAAVAPEVLAKVADARLATAKYAMDVERAKTDGYMIITQMIPNMGYHFLNPKIEGFDVTKPPILVYVRKGDAWQLVAIEWVYPKKPATAPIKGAQYGSFEAACHYKDGSFVVANAEAKCAKTNAKSGAEFGFWHPPLVTLHMWIWYPNPGGIFGEFNPLLTPFNKD